MGNVTLSKKEKRKRIISKVISFLILLGCIFGFGWQAFRCFKLYFSEPLGSEITTISTKEIPFPDLFLCHDGRNPKGEYDEDVLRKCNISTVVEYKFEGDWIGNCSDPQQLYEDSINKHIAYGNSTYMFIKSGVKGTYNRNWSTIFQPTAMSSTLDTEEFGRCVKIHIDESHVKNGINLIITMIKNIQSFRMFVVSPNGFYYQLQEYPRIRNVRPFSVKLTLLSFFLSTSGLYDSSYWAMGFLKVRYALVRVDYVYYESIPTKEEPCSMDINNDFDLCFINELHQKTMDNLGCSHPFGKNKTMICRDKEKARIAMDIYDNHLRNRESKCLRSCNYLETQLTLVETEYQDKVNDYPEIQLAFNTHVNMIKSYKTFTSLNLFAEVGGYLGIFIGAAILDFRTMLEHFILRRMM